MQVTKQKFGVLSDGSKVTLYTVSNGRMSFSVMDYGCTITSILVPDSKGAAADILLGWSTFDGYVTGKGSFNAFVGRFANRISNARFTVGGKEYKLDVNDHNNSLHGGFTRYEKMMYESRIVETEYGTGVKFSRLSRDGEQGYPGNVAIDITYTLNEFNELSLLYTAATDAATPVNFTNHAYFNLAGNGTINNHLLKMNCTRYLEVDPCLIPTGKLLSVQGTPLDFTAEKTVGQDIDKTGIGGYDHCFVTEAYDPHKNAFENEKLVHVCTLTDPVSGRTMNMSTNQIGVQLYSGNFVEGMIGKNGRCYHNHESICLESQCFPDTPNKSDFPSCVLTSGEKYKSLTVYSFSS